jgi:hypothetical protein
MLSAELEPAIPVFERLQTHINYAPLPNVRFFLSFLSNFFLFFVFVGVPQCASRHTSLMNSN